MKRSASQRTVFDRFCNWIWGPQILAFLPALSLGAFWLFGEGGLIVVTLVLPVLWSMHGRFDRSDLAAGQPSSRDASQSQDAVVAKLTQLFTRSGATDKITVFHLAIDDVDHLKQRFSAELLDDIQERLHMRYAALLRTTDIVARIAEFTWTIALSPSGSFDLEVAIQQASRLQTALDDPFFCGSERLYLTACIGFAFTNAPCDDVGALLDQAHVAHTDAVRNGPDAIRAYSSAMAHSSAPEHIGRSEEVHGEIKQCLTAWFQPQICTDTGQVSGFEALARWQNAGGDMLVPPQFMPVLEKSGQMERLTELMLSQSLSAICKWDKAGFQIDTVGVNVSEHDLSDPRFFDKVAWDLDRFGVPAHRLCIEVLESVVAGGEDEMINRNVSRLAKIGCQIDLDDFGTGHASISTLRRLPVCRLKIDRSFVARSDLDAEQQKMVSTIMMMAERLGLRCLAEGVETLGEHAILAQLGCTYVQGFGIAKPMPFEATLDWIKDYQAKLERTPEIIRKSR